MLHGVQKSESGRGLFLLVLKDDHSDDDRDDDENDDA